ncbi:hypothetical protein [Xanthomarina sp.]|uniref:hypothetical protein n=1 Tax=Xanthomarina sp. TaxID=1931211 RepID=UPI002BFFB286|nr:hypothetical protein [Xanthomarina sp.]HLV39738.1 hypothetical protein [Xanthomarina sp.]
MFFALTLFVGCDDSQPEADTNVLDEAGLLIDVSSSGGALLGSPDANFPIAEAPVTFSDVELNFSLKKLSGNLDNIAKLEVVKILNGDVNQGKTEISVAETATLPFSFSYTTLEEFLVGTGMDADDLRIGDSFTFRVKVHQTDGDVYYYSRGMGRVSLTVNCAYDLSGMYTMTNSICASSQVVQITQNPDGTWNLPTADGGLLQFCSTNNTLVNGGSIAVGCGGIVTEAVSPTYCGSNGIGCIVGGSWDQDDGILILNNTNTFFTWGAAEYTSTYTRL